MKIYIATVTIEISDQMGKYETRIIGAFDSSEKATVAQQQCETQHRTRRTAYKTTQVELNSLADWGGV